MQLLPRYLAKQTTTLVANVSGFITEYRPVYSKQLQLYRGIDNVLDFRLLNADQKPVDITTYTPRLVAFDENMVMVLDKNGTILDDGSTVDRGKFKVTVTENELLNVKQQYLTYNVYMEETDGAKVLTYSHSNFESHASIFVNATAFPGPIDSKSVATWSREGVGIDTWYSSSIDAQPGINGNDVQGTLDNQVTGTTQWADIATIQLGGSETAPQPINFNGVFSHVRFKATADPADKITKILVRN